MVTGASSPFVRFSPPLFREVLRGRTDITGKTGFLTTYSYIAESSGNQVTTVTQAPQTRIFKTDSLGRSDIEIRA